MAKHLWTEVILQVPGVHSWDFFCVASRGSGVFLNTHFTCVHLYLKLRCAEHLFGTTISAAALYSLRYTVGSRLLIHSPTAKNGLSIQKALKVMQEIIKHSSFEHCLLWPLGRKIWVERCFPSSFLYLRERVWPHFPALPIPHAFECQSAIQTPGFFLLPQEKWTMLP